MKSIAIDGPAGAGKSTAAKAVAKKLGYIYVDTGALYRAVALHAVNKGVNTSSEMEIAPILSEIEVNLDYVDGEQKIYLCGKDVSKDIRMPEMGMAASNVSAIPCVREFLLNLQRDMAKKYNVVMDGRDIGTVVLPNADVKIFLTADIDARARRRHSEHIAKGQEISYNQVLKDIEKRDYNDSSRSTAPLKKANDAIEVDSSNLDFDATVEKILNIIRGCES